jgi:hypothetical protein
LQRRYVIRAATLILCLALVACAPCIQEERTLITGGKVP